MILEGYLTTFGAFAEKELNIEILPCPNCNKKVVAKATKELIYNPPQIGLMCPECGYRTDKRIRTTNFEEGIKIAAASWNNDARIRYYEDKLKGE